MKFISFIPMALLCILVFPGLLQAAGCQSQFQGYCLQLAASNFAATETGLEFLQLNNIGTGTALSRIYVFGLGLVALSALVMMVYGGVLYMTAGDSQDRVKQARTSINNSIFGLVIALLAWLILYTINPSLVKNVFPELTPITPVTPVK